MPTAVSADQGLVRGIVLGVGKVPNIVAIVGEAPGATEAQLGQPFVGKTGKEQDDLFARHGLVCRNFYKTNVVKAYIEGNPDPTPERVREWTPHLIEELRLVNPKVVIAVGRFAMRWFLGESAQLDACHGLPHPPGAFDASRADRLPKGCIVVPVTHPAAGFYSPEARAVIAEDYERACAVIKDVQAGRAVWTRRDELAGREIYLDMTGEEFAQAVDAERVAVNANKLMALDTEGSPSKPWSLQVSFEPGTAMMVRTSQPDFNLAAQAVQRWADAGHLIITHDANTPQGCMYDTLMCRAMGIELRWARLWNTMYAAYLLRTVSKGYRSKGLKLLAYRWAGMEMDSYKGTVERAGLARQLDYLGDVLERKWPKPETQLVYKNDGSVKVYTPQAIDKRVHNLLLKMGEPDVDLYRLWHRIDDVLRKPVEAELGRMPFSALDDVPLDVATRYACRDADATLRVYYALRAEIEKRDLVQLMDDGMKVLPIFEEMQSTGLPASRHKFEVLVDEMNTKMYALNKRISKLYYGGKPFNPKSTKQVGALLRRRGLEPAKRTKTGQMSTGKQSIEHLRYKDPAIADVVEFRERQHIRDMFGEPMLEIMQADIDVQTVHTNINPLGTTTRRLATNDPNLLAFPKHEKPGGNDYGKQIRACFECPPGMVLLECDLSQIEVRMLAHESADPVLIKAFIDERDVHMETAIRVFGVPPDVAADPKYWKEGAGKVQRFFAKRVTFGIAYGVSGMGLSTQLRVAGIEGWDDRTCDKLIREWLKLYKGCAQYFDAVEREVSRLGYVRDCWGMYRYLPGVWSDDIKVASEARRQAINHRIQGGAQGCIQKSMAYLRRPIYNLQQSGLDVRWVLQVHDALMFLVDEQICDDVESLVMDAMCNHHCLPNPKVPILADSKRATSWGQL